MARNTSVEEAFLQYKNPTIFCSAVQLKENNIYYPGHCFLLSILVLGGGKFLKSLFYAFSSANNVPLLPKVVVSLHLPLRLWKQLPNCSFLFSATYFFKHTFCLVDLCKLYESPHFVPFPFRYGGAGGEPASN